MLENLLMLHWASSIQNDNNQITSTSNSYDLLTSTLSILRTFNDSWKVEQLYFCAFIVYDSGNTGEGGELVGGNLGEGACKLG